LGRTRGRLTSLDQRERLTSWIKQECHAGATLYRACEIIGISVHSWYRWQAGGKVIADLPFGSYQISPQQAYASAAELMAAGAEMVKLEGGMIMAETVDFLANRGIPVCTHIGLQPQSVNVYGGYKVQGKSEFDAEVLKRDALAHQAAGAAMVLMEMVPAHVAKTVTEALTVPTIGIGAGVDVDGQVLVLHDMLAVYPGKKARFVKNFMAGSHSIQAAVEAYVKAVKSMTFPADEHSF
jgi:3-methyl-2-oxobutanoate hydroxymethyltransferase